MNSGQKAFKKESKEAAEEKISVVLEKNNISPDTESQDITKKSKHKRNNEALEEEKSIEEMDEESGSLSNNMDQSFELENLGSRGFSKTQVQQPKTDNIDDDIEFSDANKNQTVLRPSKPFLWHQI